MLALKNLTLRYGEQTVLKNVSFSVNEGEILGLLGPNGAGKSSIIKILAGLIKPQTGLVTYNNDVILFSDLRQFCGYLIDSPGYYPYLSAFDNLKLTKRINKSKVNCQLLLSDVGLGHVYNKKVKHFSTGMKQRLAIANALIRNPKLLILDEPFNGLDPNGYKDIIELLKSLNSKGTTIIVSSHLLNELEVFATTFVLINKGEVALNISKKNLLKSKRKVAFTFAEVLNAKSKDLIKKQQGFFKTEVLVELELKPESIAPLVNKLVSLGSVPINIQTYTVLQDTYFELAK
ncbi:MAG: ATP-binding cassette domain-containing protein [Winogradskyella sp.]|nr:ATP-binding cassette domain-containing protein [Winogradskyella sp.]